MIKSITIDCDPGDIPQGYSPKAEFRKPKRGDMYFYTTENRFIVAAGEDYNFESLCLIPALKQIDWQKMIGKPVEFLQNDEWVLGKLKNYGEGGKFPFVIDGKGKTFSQARPAHNIPFGHNGCECPLPAGIKVRARIYDYEPGHGLHDDGGWRHSYYKDDSEHIPWDKVVSYEIIGISEGYEL